MPALRRGRVDEARAKGEPDRHPPGTLEQGEVTGGQVGHEGRGERGVAAPGVLAALAGHGAHRCPDELDIDVVGLHRDLDPDPDHTVPVHLAALPPQQAGGLIHGGVVGVRGQRNGASPPVPHPDRNRHDSDTDHEVQRLPPRRVQQQGLVDREVRGDAALSR